MIDDMSILSILNTDCGNGRITNFEDHKIDTIQEYFLVMIMCVTVLNGAVRLSIAL